MQIIKYRFSIRIEFLKYRQMKFDLTKFPISIMWLYVREMNQYVSGKFKKKNEKNIFSKLLYRYIDSGFLSLILFFK